MASKLLVLCVGLVTVASAYKLRALRDETGSSGLGPFDPYAAQVTNFANQGQGYMAPFTAMMPNNPAAASGDSKRSVRDETGSSGLGPFDPYAAQVTNFASQGQGYMAPFTAMMPNNPAAAASGDSKRSVRDETGSSGLGPFDPYAAQVTNFASQGTGYMAPFTAMMPNNPAAAASGDSKRSVRDETGSSGLGPFDPYAAQVTNFASQGQGYMAPFTAMMPNNPAAASGDSKRSVRDETGSSGLGPFDPYAAQVTNFANQGQGYMAPFTAMMPNNPAASSGEGSR